MSSSTGSRHGRGAPRRHVHVCPVWASPTMKGTASRTCAACGVPYVRPLPFLCEQSPGHVTVDRWIRGHRRLDVSGGWGRPEKPPGPQPVGRPPAQDKGEDSDQDTDGEGGDTPQHAPAPPPKGRGADRPSGAASERAPSEAPSQSSAPRRKRGASPPPQSTPPGQGQEGQGHGPGEDAPGRRGLTPPPAPRDWGPDSGVVS